MTLTDKQIEMLSAPLDPKHVATRQQSGQRLSYVESWHVIAEANRIFGFDGWSSETVDVRCVSERERKMGRDKDRDGWGVTYVAKVRVTVGGVVREGTGAGSGIDADLGLAHESAIKESESDARKRALMTFGNPFGLALYDKTQANVQAPPPPVIDDAQWALLTDLIAKTNSDSVAMCEHYRIASLKEMTVPMFEDASARLRKRLVNEGGAG